MLAGAGGTVSPLVRRELPSFCLTLARCVFAGRDEPEPIAASGAIIAVNTSSTLGLRSGIDGVAWDEDDDAVRAMRPF